MRKTKSKLQLYSLDRIHRQAVINALEDAQETARKTGAAGAVIMLLTKDGRTILKAAGQLSQEKYTTAELFKAAVRIANE